MSLTATVRLIDQPRGAYRTVRPADEHRRQDDIIGDMRCVLDTNVIVAAMRSPLARPPHPACRPPRITDLVANVALAVEYEATCSRAEHQLAAGLAADQVRIFVDAVIAMAQPRRNALPVAAPAT
ncbi:MAG: hypothetical protein R3E83_22050 [Burkholderiaceae bacterium]